VLGHVNAGLNDKRLLDPILDNQIAETLAPLGIGEKVIVAEEHNAGLDRFQLFNDRFDGPFRVAPLLSEGIETEGAEFAFEWTSPRRQDRVERLAAQSNALLKKAILLSSQRPVRKWELGDIRQRVVFVVNDVTVFPIGQSENILGRDPGDNLPNDLFALAPDNQVDIRTAIEKEFDVQGGFVSPDNGGHFRGQLSDILADFGKSKSPANGNAEQIDLVPDELAQLFRVLIPLFIPKVEKSDFADQVLHAGGDVLQAGRGENPHRAGAISEKWA
jgi:hypothetical protein